MIFEFDARKSAANKHKHGIDFVEAQALWKDPDTVTMPAKDYGREQRDLVIGKIGDKYWTAIATWRSDNVRLISVRRSRTKEVAFYESIKTHQGIKT